MKRFAAPIVVVITVIAVSIFILTSIGPRGATVVRIISGVNSDFSSKSLVSQGSNLWVAQPGIHCSGSIVELSGKTGHILRRLDSQKFEFSCPMSLALVGEDLWVVNSEGGVSGYGSITVIATKSGTLVRNQSSFIKYQNPADITNGGKFIWSISDPDDLEGRGVVSLLDPKTGEILRSVSGSKNYINDPIYVTSSGNHVWVSNLFGGFHDNGTVSEYDGNSGSLIKNFRTKNFTFVRGLVCRGSKLWMIRSDGSVHGAGVLTEINWHTGALVRNVSGFTNGINEPGGILSEGGHIWVTSLGSDLNPTGLISEFDANSGSLLQKIRGAGQIDEFLGISRFGSTIWIAYGGGFVQLSI